MSTRAIHWRRGRITAICALGLALVVACEREKRRFNDASPSAPAYAAVTLDTLQPGVPSPELTVKSPSEGNAYDIAQGKQLFAQWNCSGCHSHGGGGMGPPLMDNEWIYGSSPANIYLSIAEGRPNGMPSFGGHIPDAQIWEIVTYVRALGGFESQPATSPRSDGMESKR